MTCPKGQGNRHFGTLQIGKTIKRAKIQFQVIQGVQKTLHPFEIRNQIEFQDLHDLSLFYLNDENIMKEISYLNF